MMWLAQVDGPRPQANPTSNPQIYSPDQSCFGGKSKSGLSQLVKLQLRSDTPKAEVFIRMILQLTAQVFKVLAFTFQNWLLVSIFWKEGEDQMLCWCLYMVTLVLFRPKNTFWLCLEKQNDVILQLTNHPEEEFDKSMQKISKNLRNFFTIGCRIFHVSQTAFAITGYNEPLATCLFLYSTSG